MVSTGREEGMGRDGRWEQIGIEIPSTRIWVMKKSNKNIVGILTFRSYLTRSDSFRFVFTHTETSILFVLKMAFAILSQQKFALTFSMEIISSAVKLLK